MMDEEDSLSHQLEQEQEQALESALAEEKVYLDAIACEENTEIEDMTTANEEEEADKTDTDSELTVSGGPRQTQTVSWRSVVANDSRW